MLKKIILLSVIASSFIFSSCSKNSDSNNQADSNSNDESYSIWIPGDENEYQFYFDMFENYKLHKEQSGKKFEYSIEQQPWSDYWTKLPLEINEGRGPDMYLAHDAYMDVLLPISKELDLDESILKELRVKGIYVGENGKDKFVPTLLSSYIMFANKELTGLTDSYPTTWTELEQQAKDDMAKNSGVIGFDYNFNTVCDITYRDGMPLTQDGKVVFHKEQLEKVLGWEKEGISNYLLYGNGSPEEAFNQNSTAFMHGATWMEFWAPEDMKDKMLAFPVPDGENDSDIVYTNAEPTFGINKNVSDEKYAVLNDFIKFMLTDEDTLLQIVKGNSGIPNNQSIEVTYEPFTAGDAVLKTFENRKIAYTVMPRDLEKIYKDNLEKALSGEDLQSIIDNSYIESENVAVDRLSKMEEAFRDSFK